MTTPVGSLTRAFKLEYLDALHGRLADPKRLKAVWDARFRLMPEKDKLESIVLSACYLLDAPSGGLMLVTGNTQEVLVGQGEPTDLPVETSFCQHVTDGQPFGVDDAMNDLLVCNMEVVLDGAVRAYLGVPVIFWKQVIGSLCVWDSKPREWTTTDVRALSALSLTVQELLG